LGQVSIVSHSYQTYFGFPGSDLNLDCGLRDHVITRFASHIQNKVCSMINDGSSCANIASDTLVKKLNLSYIKHPRRYRLQ